MSGEEPQRGGMRSLAPATASVEGVMMRRRCRWAWQAEAGEPTAEPDEPPAMECCARGKSEVRYRWQ